MSLYKNIVGVKVTITRITDDSFPSFVEAMLTDYQGEAHYFTDKLPVFSLEDNPKLPYDGTIRCIVIQDNTESCLIDTSVPDDVRSIQGIFTFEVHKNQIVFDI